MFDTWNIYAADINSPVSQLLKIALLMSLKSPPIFVNTFV